MRNFLVLIGSALLMLYCGCGSSTWGTASGTVSLDGTALESGVITFHPEGGGATAYGQITNGAFTLFTGQEKGLMTGKYDVTISASTIPEPGSNEKSKLLTPQKYSSPETTDLHEEVTSGSNSFKFDLKSI